MELADRAECSDIVA